MIPGLESREFYMLIWICILTALGSVGNYLLWKRHKKDNYRITTMVRYTILGVIAGVILSSIPGVTTSIGHWQIVPIALFFGAQAEYLCAMYLNSAHSPTNTPPIVTTTADAVASVGASE